MKEFLNREALMLEVASQLDSEVVGESSVLLNDEVPEDLQDFIDAVHFTRKAENHYEAIFFYGKGFPVKHSAWCYATDGTPPDDEWHVYKKMKTNWFDIGN